MGWLTGRDSDEPASGKSKAQLDREINEALEEGPSPVLTPGSARPLAPFPGPRKGGGKTPARTSSKLAPRAKAMSEADFMASLRPPLSRRGKDAVSTAEVAKRVREECAEAIKVGVLPPGTKVSVTSEHKTLDVKISAWEGQVFAEDWAAHLMDPKGTPFHEEGRFDTQRSRRLTGSLNRAVDLLEKLGERHNYDRSDSQSDYFDYGYLLTVNARPVERAAEAGIKAESDPKFKELIAQAYIAARQVGPAATKAYVGGDVNNSNEWDLTRLIKLAVKTKGREAVYDKQRGWIPKGV